MTDNELTAADLYGLALRARDAAQQHFEAAVPGWPDNLGQPIGAAGLNAHTVLLERERELVVARSALLDTARPASN